MSSHGRPRAIAIAFLGLFDAAEADEGQPARLLGRHPGADVVVDVQLQVALELVRKVAVAPAAT